MDNLTFFQQNAEGADSGSPGKQRNEVLG